MSEQRAQGPPGGRDADEILWILLRDLAVLSRAQARLMGDLARLIGEMRRGMTTPGQESVAPVAPASGPTAPPVPVDDAAAVEAISPAGKTEIAGSPAAPAAPEGTVDAPLSADERATLLEVNEGAEGNGKRWPAEEARIPVEAELGREGAPEGPDDFDESVNEEAAVLILESGDARVGVLWDHVIQIGSLGSPVIPEKVETERGAVELVSLGLLLHGVSREEKYFVVLEQDEERAAVACERMLGVGPLGAAIQQERGARIQVLRVPMLRTFAASAILGGAKGVSPEDQAAADERDRHGPLRALVAVRYLPARVAICRHLRGRGWQVGEAAGLEAATVSLDLGRWDLLFLEAHGNGESEATEGMLLRRVTERGVPVIRVGSRISGFPGRDGPALMFPFSESELDAILTEKRGSRSV